MSTTVLAAQQLES